MTDHATNPFDCTDVKALISGLIDDTVDHATRHSAERHLAQCATCRDLINEVECADALLVEATRLVDESERLPDGFTPAVLSRTVYADRLRGHNAWMAWLGWVTAAAALFVAASTWFVNGRVVSPARHAVPIVQNYNPSTHTSWVSDGKVSAEQISRLKMPDRPITAPLPINEHFVTPADPDAVRVNTLPAMQWTLSPGDAETLDSAAVLMGRLARADVESFVDLETIRRAAEYERLRQRLITVRRQLPAAERSSVLAVESILFHLEHGPHSLADLRELRATVGDLDLAQRLTRLGKYATATAL